MRIIPKARKLVLLLSLFFVSLSYGEVGCFQEPEGIPIKDFDGHPAYARLCLQTIATLAVSYFTYMAGVAYVQHQHHHQPQDPYLAGIEGVSPEAIRKLLGSLSLAVAVAGVGSIWFPRQ
jgi:hypothetical protein